MRWILPELQPEGEPCRSRCQPQWSQGRSRTCESDVRIIAACTLLTHAAVSSANACRLLKGTAVQGNPHVDLVRRGAVRNVPLDGLVGRDIRAHTAVQVG